MIYFSECTSAPYRKMRSDQTRKLKVVHFPALKIQVVIYNHVVYISWPETCKVKLDSFRSVHSSQVPSTFTPYFHFPIKKMSYVLYVTINRNHVIDFCDCETQSFTKEIPSSPDKWTFFPNVKPSFCLAPEPFFCYFSSFSVSFISYRVSKT